MWFFLKILTNDQQASHKDLISRLLGVRGLVRIRIGWRVGFLLLTPSLVLIKSLCIVLTIRMLRTKNFVRSLGLEGKEKCEKRE